MRIILFFLFYGIFSSALMSTILSGFPLGRFFSVDLILIAVATMAFDNEIPYKIPSLFIISALRDVSSALPWGSSFLAFLIVLSAFKFLNRTISLHHKIAIGVWTGVISILSNIVIAIILTLASKNTTANNILIYSIPQSIGDGLLSVITVPYLIKIVNFIAGDKIKHSEKIGIG